ncbi:hypothetical protein D3C85_1089690 [compost metagenome]
MPGRSLARVWLLDQQVIVIKPGCLTVHELRCNTTYPAFEDELAIGRNIPPITEVFEEPTRVIRAACHFSALAWGFQVLFDAGFEQCNFFRREQITYADGTITLESLDGFVTQLKFGGLFHKHPLVFLLGNSTTASFQAE